MRPTKVFLLLALLAACGGADPADTGGDDDPGTAPDAGDDPEPDAGGELPPTRPPGVALCYTDLSSNHPATVGFWDAMRADAKDERPAVIEALQDALDQHPDQEEFALLLGLGHLWRLAEPLPDEANDLLGQLTAVQGAESNLDTARELCPTDYRIAAWLGPIKIRMGRMFMNQAQVDEGFAILDEGIEFYPGFVLFSKLLVHADAPRDSADFQAALDAVVDNIDYCTGVNDPACSNHAHAAHNIEGSKVFLGDVYAKAGDRAAALEAYQSAMDVPDYDRWDWHDLLADRIDTLDARIAAFDTATTDDDPESMWAAGNQCSICHAD